MSKRKTQKKPKGKAPRVKTWKNPRQKAQDDLARLSRDFYYWRYHEDEWESPVVTHKVTVGEPGGISNPQMEQLLEYEVQHQSLIWHCLTITYCRGQWDKEYLSPGYAKTNDRIQLAYDSLEPIMWASLKESEGTMNLKHVYARAVLISPRSQDNHDILKLVKAQKENLKLTDHDVDEIQKFLEDQTNVIYECDRIDNLDLDDKIANLL